MVSVSDGQIGDYVLDTLSLNFGPSANIDPANLQRIVIVQGRDFFGGIADVGAASTKPDPTLNLTDQTSMNWILSSSTDWALGAVAVFAAPLPPTSARVTISGRVIQSSGKGVARTLVTLTGMDGETRTAMTNFFGYYHFESILAGRTYIVSAASKSHSFNPQVVTVNENLSGLNFVAGP